MPDGLGELVIREPTDTGEKTMKAKTLKSPRPGKFVALTMLFGSVAGAMAALQPAELIIRDGLNVTDVILHLTVNDPNQLTPADIAMLYERGITPKIFMVRPTFDRSA
jgi:hypothetical protein